MTLYEVDNVLVEDFAFMEQNIIWNPADAKFKSAQISLRLKHEYNGKEYPAAVMEVNNGQDLRSCGR